MFQIAVGIAAIMAALEGRWFVSPWMMALSMSGQAMGFGAHSMIAQGLMFASCACTFVGAVLLGRLVRVYGRRTRQ
ncbi:hypothetical protein V5738_01520 [Salinisphaera sp. SPP-AMP-43]|uniref:hypothetical protein n=1 Tax=Salinisphaera sp. SPP-AMP-43 TaxID=3121288 RepID=UPI003C6E7F0D